MAKKTSAAPGLHLNQQRLRAAPGLQPIQLKVRVTRALKVMAARNRDALLRLVQVTLAERRPLKEKDPPPIASQPVENHDK
jgi:hypothetical protein